MTRINALGDIEVTDAKTMRALAHPIRLALFERLQRHGPATSGQLSNDVGTTPSAAARDLHRLAALGLVTSADDAEGPGHRRWQAVARGIRFEPSDDDESQAAYRALSNQMFMLADQLPRRWMAESEPRLEPKWRRVSGFVNARMTLTLEEAEALDAQMEELLIPYVTRDPSDAPEGARAVRLLRYLMPEAAPSAETERP
jgi:DNA-binding transcriptional ArsR family regulator